VFKKFFGKKNDGFFLQLEDEDASSKPEAKAKTKPESAPTPAPIATVVKEATPVAPASTTAPAAVTPATTTAPATAAAKVDKKAAKADKKSVKKAETPKVEAPAPVVSAPAAPPITNFATDYLIKPSSNSSRRLPGANMRGFLELARQVEKPKAFKASATERKASAEKE
jgi:hypothetical protein